MNRKIPKPILFVTPAAGLTRDEVAALGKAAGVVAVMVNDMDAVRWGTAIPMDNELIMGAALETIANSQEGYGSVQKRFGVAVLNILRQPREVPEA